MGNQQRNSNKDMGWLGGFIDGEGSLMVIKGKSHWVRSGGVKREQVRFDPAIKISGTEPKGLDHLLNILDRLGLPYHVYWRIPHNALHKKSWMVETKGMKRCARWCEILVDCLVIKKCEAKAMIEYCQSRLAQKPCAGHTKPPYTERQLELIQALRGRRIGTRLC